jgi:tartrate-resistant acid phosphatase type 5
VKGGIAALIIVAISLLAGCIEQTPGDGGTGDENQYAVAAAMEKICAARGCDFVLGLGDNIYENGPADEYDSQFDEKFERPYANFSIPFYMALGNHDNGGGNGANAAGGDAEVRYAARTDRASEKWQMPARWYTFQEGPARFIVMDSGPQETNMLPAFLPLVNQREMDQAAFLRDAVAEPHDATWVFAVSHHPHISNGQHGNAGNYDGIPGAGTGWKDLLESTVCGHADIMFAGHDHDLQWLRPTPDCDSDIIVSGAAGKTRSVGDQSNEALFEVYDTYGFWWIQITGDVLRAIPFDALGTPLYTIEMHKGDS